MCFILFEDLPGSQVAKIKEQIRRKASAPNFPSSPRDRMGWFVSRIS